MLVDIDFAATRSAELVDRARQAVIEARTANPAVVLDLIRLGIEDFALITRIKQREVAHGVPVTLMGLYIALDRTLASGQFVVAGEASSIGAGE